MEKTVGILAVTITTLGGVAIRSDPLVSISGHAIARWFERTRSRDQARLLRDIGMILDSTEPDHAVASKGLWLGSTVNAHQGERRLTLRTIRTYLDADQIDTRRPARVARDFAQASNLASSGPVRANFEGSVRWDRELA